MHVKERFINENKGKERIALMWYRVQYLSTANCNAYCRLH